MHSSGARMGGDVPSLAVPLVRIPDVPKSPKSEISATKFRLVQNRLIRLVQMGRDLPSREILTSIVGIVKWL